MVDPTDVAGDDAEELCQLLVELDRRYAEGEAAPWDLVWAIANRAAVIAGLAAVDAPEGPLCLP